MKFKRFSAAITALAVATAAALSLSIVTADTRDRVAGFDNAKLNDYDMLDYEDMTDGIQPDGDTDPDSEGEGSEDADPDLEGDGAEDGGETEGDPDGEGEGDTEGGDTEGEGDNGDDDGDKEPEILTWDGFTFEVQEDGTLSLIGYDGKDKNIAIPARVEGMAVTAIAAGTFAGCELVSAGIPEGVTYIGEGAFADCPALLWAYIPETVEYIGEGAFVCLPDEDNEDRVYGLTVFGHSASFAESYADENGIGFFPLGAKLTDSLLGFEVILQEGDGSEELVLNVTDGYHNNTDTANYFYIRFSGGSPERPVIVKAPVPYWDNVKVYLADGEVEISSICCDGYVIFIADSFDGEFMIVLDETADDGNGSEEGEGGEVTDPSVTEPTVTTTEEPAVTTTPVTTTTPNTTTAPPETTTEPVETTTTIVTDDEPAETTTPVTVDEPAETTPVTADEPAATTTAPPAEAAPAVTGDPLTTMPPAEDEDNNGDSEDEGNGDKVIEDSNESILGSNAELIDPPIEVTVPTSITAIINPYGVKVNIKGVIYSAAGISSPVYTIINKTTGFNIKVQGTASLTVPSVKYTNELGVTASKPSIQVLDSPEKIAGQTVKSACAYVLAYTSSAQIDRDTSEDELPDLFANGEPAFNSNTLVFADLTDPETTGNTANTGTIAVLGMAEEDTFTYAQFKISGEVTSNDVDKWTTSDKINLSLVLDIAPTGDPATV